MEFDRHSFIFDVNAALGYNAPENQSDGNAGEDSVVEEGDDAMLMYNQYVEDFTTISSQASSHGTPQIDSQERGPSIESLEESSSGLPNWVYPELDMSTAMLASPSVRLAADYPVYQPERNEPWATTLMSNRPSDLVPSFYTYAITSCLLPIRKIQQELFILYFQYIHPMFPVINETYFTELHRVYRGHEQFMDQSDFIVYQAILAAGFGHLSEHQLRRTPYRSVHEGQEAQFDQARYRLHPTSDPVVLTQTCLLISLWSPGPAGAQNNSYWLNLAFKHANAGELWTSTPTNSARSCHRKVLWWCCLVRDRILALGMRRPYRLHKPAFEEDLISELDFRDISAGSLPSEPIPRNLANQAFVWLCKLSEIMAAIAVFQQQTKFAREWDGPVNINLTSELEQVAAFDNDLAQWKRAFEASVSTPSGSNVESNPPIPFCILRIVCNSLVAVLYQPYLHVSWLGRPSSLSFDIDPLERMKEGSQGVESSIIGLIKNEKTDALPNWLVSWVTLPVAVYYVQQHCKQYPAPDPVLVPFLKRFMRRTTGAQYLFMTLMKALKEFLQELKVQESSTTALECTIAPATYQLDSEKSDYSPGKKTVEAKTLAYVTKALDSTLELGC